MTTASSVGPRPLGARLRFALLCAALVGAFGLSVQALAWQFNLLRASAAHTALLAAVAVVLARSPCESLARRVLGPLGPVALWRALTAATVALALCLSRALASTLGARYSFLGSPTRLWEQEPEFVAIPLVAFVAALLTSKGTTASSRRFLGSAALATACALLLCGLGALRAARTTELLRWIATIPVRATVPSLGGEVSAGRDPSLSHLSVVREVSGVRVGIYAFPERSVCVGVVLGAGPPPRVLRFEEYMEQLCPCRQLQLRLHERAGILVLGGDPLEYYTPSVALDARSGALVSATEPRIRRELSAPTAWLALSGALALAALALLLVPSRERRALSGIARWSEGRLREDGSIELPGGVVVPCPYSLDLEVGPVVLTEPLPSAAPRVAPFRDKTTMLPPRHALYGGTLASVAASLESALDARRAAALFAAAASAAPLLAALSQGLLP